MRNLLFLFAIAFLSSGCSSKPYRSIERADGDFFAIVAKVQVLDTSLDTIHNALEMGTGEVLDETRGRREAREAGVDRPKNNNWGQFFVGAFVGAITGAVSDLQKTHYQYQYHLRDMDDEIVAIYGDAQLSLGDCVYIDAPSKSSNKNKISISVVDRSVCEDEST